VTYLVGTKDNVLHVTATSCIIGEAGELFFSTYDNQGNVTIVLCLASGQWLSVGDESASKNITPLAAKS
jgi:hypothetical protein